MNFYDQINRNVNHELGILAIERSQGNPGALNFLMNVINSPNKDQSEVILNKLEETRSLKGTDLYVLYSDLCEKDLNKVEKLCANCPTDILIDACKRQDYSGIKLVEQFLI